jgi:hypothetical protein
MLRRVEVAMLRMLAMVLVAVVAGCGLRPEASSKARRGDPVVAAVLDSSGRLATQIRADARVQDAISDARGGWYVNGPFRRLDGQAVAGLAHLLPDGRLDSPWRPPAALSSWYGRRDTSVSFLVMAASARTLYIAHIQGDTGSFELAVLDARTGAQLAPIRQIASNAPALAADDQHLYIANTLPISSCVSEYDRLAEHLLAHFAVHMLPEVGCVNALIPAGGSVYVAGSLGINATLPGAAVARFDSATGRLDHRWRPQLSSCSTCYGLAYDIALGDGKVFENPGAAGALEALDAGSGAPLPSWRAPRLPGNEPAGLAVAGKRLFVLVGSARLVTLDTRTGALLPCWQPPGGMRPAAVEASGAQVLVELQSIRSRAVPSAS